MASQTEVNISTSQIESVVDDDRLNQNKEKNFRTKLLARTEKLLTGTLQKLQIELDKNPYYPFIPRDDTTLEFQVVNKALYAGLAGAGLALVVLIIFLAGGLEGNAFFALPFIFLVISAMTAYNYKDTRYYRLVPDRNEYTFYLNKTLMTKDQLYNIYIRLKREIRSGSTKKYYHIILGGYGMDPVQISGSSRRFGELRSFGQLIALNLGINYFDEANTSAHHQVRHFKPDRQKLGLQGLLGNKSTHSIRKLAASQSASVASKLGQIGPKGSTGNIPSGAHIMKSGLY